MPARFHVDHVIARQHSGGDTLDNLALACPRCNLTKGTNLSGIDPRTGGLEALFNPRLDDWTEHFRFEGAKITGVTPTGRATVQTLGMNLEDRLQLREEMLAAGEL